MIANIKRYAMRRINLKWSDSTTLKTSNMKLYTEEQIKQVIAYYNIEKFVTTDELLEDLKLTPIELPSDEEINETAWIKTTGEMRQYGYDIRKSFFIGAKWMKEQILNQNK